MNQIKNVQRGADPELFLLDRYGAAVSSIGRVGGSKHFPRPFAEGFAVQEDNVAVEFNIPASSSKEDFINNIQFALSYLEQEMAQQELSLAIVPTLEFDEESLSHPHAREMGCDPDYNVWTGRENPRPKAPPSLRSAGGHLHLSWDDPSQQEAEKIIIAHDLFCSCPSIKIDTNTLRRSIYGKAGAFRYKPYGVEYRTPSNFWIQSKELVDWMFTQSEKAISWLNAGLFLDKEDFTKVQECINNSNHELLSELNEKYGMV
jgi:hypothetical protein